MAFDPPKRPSFLRLLIVEDNLEREQQLRARLPVDIKLVVATSAGKAMGVLRLDKGRVYAGIVLDHDLQERSAPEADPFLSGKDVVEAVIRYVSKDVPILVHFINSSQSTIMVNRLREADFGVTKIPMDILTKESFQSWIEYVREVWSDLQA